MAAILDVVNRLADGFVAVAVIDSFHRHGLFSAISGGHPSVEELGRSAGANMGHLRVALRLLDGLGWIDIDRDDRLRLTATGAALAADIPAELPAMLAALPDAVAGDGAGLVPWLELCARGWADGGRRQVADVLDGGLLSPVLVELARRGSSGALDSGEHPFGPAATDALMRVLLANQWAEPGEKRPQLNAAGRFLVDSGAKMGAVGSYWPMLQQMDVLLFGDTERVFSRDADGHERHLDRRQNIFGSTAQHGSFFREMEDRVVGYFEGLPLEAQPTHIADLGCGDGTLLKRLYAAVTSRTRRGAELARFPLTLIAADFNQSSLDAARENLAGFPSLTVQADIGNPAAFVAALAAQGVPPEGVLHVRSFVDHDRPLLALVDEPSVAGRQRFVDSSVHVDEAGGSIETAVAVQSLAEHLARWRDVRTPHGLLILEVHCLAPATVRPLGHATEALHFDAYHGFARQHLVEASTFLLMAAEAGLVPQSRSALRIPRVAPYTRITLNRFAPRPYRIRLATTDDIPALLALESVAAAADLRSSPAQVERRIANFPRGQLVAEVDGSLTCAIYTQRIASTDGLRGVTFENAETLHRDDGTIGQLLWLFADPAREDQAHVEELLDFAIDYLATLAGVERVVGITRCRDYGSRTDRDLSHADYVALRDSSGLPVDPVLLMHASHGARIDRVLEGYRPRDLANGAAGVLIAYAVDDRYAVTAAKPDTAPPRVSAGTLETIVCEAVERVLGAARQAAFQLDRPLMAMGLESLELLELRRILGNALETPLDPTFFFRHGTPAAVIRYFSEQNEPASAKPAAAAPPPSQSADRTTGDGFAIVGLACRLPGAPDGAASFWRLLANGGDAVREIDAERWALFQQADKRAADLPREGALLTDIDRFDAAFFNISPREAQALDPQQRLLLETTWQALEHAGIAVPTLAGSSTGMFLGLMGHDYETLLLRSGVDEIDGHFATGNSGSIAAGRIAHFFDWHGPAITIDTACSSSLVAVHQACRALRAGDCSVALAGGANLTLAPLAGLSYLRAGMLSPDGRCKTFDASANGYGRGEGVGVVVLKRLADAERDGDRVLAVIRGSAVNQDGTGIGLTAPNETAQQRLLEAALADARIEPQLISYLESHGTGTVLGDPIEVGAAGRVFGVGRGVGRPLLLGSVKANIGHLEAAAGVAGLIKVVLSLEAGELPGQVHFAEPNPHVAWASLPVEVVRTKRAWPEGRRLAGVSSFGFSGTNAHVIVEGYGAPAAAGSALPGREAQVLALSAKSAGALEALIARYAAFVGETETLSLSDVCFTAGVGRSHFAHRAAVVAQTREALASGLAGLAAGSAGVRGERRGRARVAVLFTGQGSQWAGMAQGAYASEPVFRDVVDRCCAAADALGLHGESVRAVLLAEPGTALAGLLDDTAYTQVALYGLQCGLWSLWRSWGLEADAVLGHSVGEFAAAYAAGVLDLEDGARLVARRGALMGALPAGGSMAVVFAPPAAVSAAIARVNDEAGAGEAGAGAIGLSLAAENGTHRVVSGPSALVDALVSGFAQAGVRCQALSVSHAFHSALLEPMLDALEASASGVSHRAPSLSLVSNLTGAVFAPGTHPDAAYWRRHARAPVRYAEGVATLASLGIDVLLELGPRPVLSGLALGCWPGASSPVALSALRPGVSDGRALADAVAGLYAAGGSIDFAGYGAGRGGRRVALPSYPFERVRHWMEAPRGRGRGAVGEAGHWLLGASHGSASGEVSWTQELSASEPGWTADHVVFGAVVAPGALHACLAAAAGGIAGGSGVSVRTGQIHAPLVLGEAATELQLLLAAADGSGSRGWRVFARQGEGSEPAWRLYASGVLAAADAAVAEPRLAMSGLPLSGLPLSGLVERDVVSFYAALSGLGLAYGPSFQGVERLWGGAWVARGEIVMPDGVVDGALHPAVLDACFQVLMAALPDAAMAAGPLVPLGWDGFDVWGPAPGRVVCEARVRSSADASAFVADLVLLDGAGAVFARVQGLLLKRTTRQALLGAAAGVDELLYEVAWQEAGLPTFAAGFMASPGAVVDAVRPLIGGLAAETGFEATRQSMLETLLEQASRAHAVAALRQLGWSPRVGDAVVAASLRAALGVRAEHARLFERLLELLGDAGLLTRVGEHQAGEHQAGEQAGQWLVAAPLETGPSVDAVAAEAAAYGAEGTGGITGEIAWVLLSRCGLVLAEVLRGRVAPLGLLFPEQDIGAAELYRDAPIFRLMNALLGASVARAVADLPPGRRLRVLEVGAGTGGTTAALLPLLPRERTEYVYTDVSAGFFAAGEARFGSAYPYVQFRPLDIERDPLAQGFAAGGYDLVVASNVLHATRDVVASAAHCRSLLAPGGSLVLLEELQRRGWSDLTFGLLEGWWRFADPALRPAHALLNGATWRAALQAAGYAEAAVLSPDAGELQGVVLARAPADVAAGLWLVAGDTGPGNEQSAGQGAGEQLAAALSAQGQRVVLALPGASLERDASPEASIDRWRLRTGEASDWRALLASLPAGPGLRGPGLRGVVHLAGLDAGQAAVEAISDATCGRLSGDAASIVGGALALSQGLIGHDAVPSAGLWFVTQGAQVVAGEQAGGLAGSALWGMARTLAHEHPELRVRRVDLEAGLAPSAQLAGLVDELMAPDAEDEVARRGPARLVPRLVRAGGRSPDAQARLALPQAAGWRLAKGGERTLAGLTIEPVELAEPGPGEVLVAVEAAGLNFRDVLDALGMVPVDAGPLGGEFAGRVLAVGAGVSDVAPGERVVGLAVGCFGDRVSTKRALLAPWPAGLAPAAAAALPIVFCTAALAFERAGLRPGERVLIHAGAGGVGLAAIALAHAAGAEVFATASAGKQAYLRGLGVRHVYDSRSTAFAAAILADTDGRGVDVVLNSLTGEGFVAASLQALGAGGRFVEIGKRAIWTPEAMAAARADVAYHILAVDRLQAEEPERTGAALRAVLARVESGELAPLPYVSYPLTEARAAMRHMQQARHVGKIVLTAPPAAAVVRPGVTYLITGGLGGIGLVVADWLADRGATHLALNGRRAPEAAAEAAVAALRSRGVVVELLLADVAQPGAVERMLAELDARLPPLAGVIHSVGVLRDGALANQDWPRFADVLGPKMLGAWALHCATRDRHLDMFVLFASTAGLLGNRGQANHAAANVFLDQLARHRRAQGLPGLSIDWGAWSDIGEAAERRDALEASLQAAGIGWMTPAQGLAAFDRALSGPASQLAVFAAHWDRLSGSPSALLRTILATPTRATAAPAPLAAITQRLARAPQFQRRNELTNWLAQTIQKLLRLQQPPETTIGFTALGVDSLMSVELRNRLNAELKLDPPMPATVLFDSPNVEALADTIEQRLGLATAALEVAAPISAPASTADAAIAIVGIAARLPGAPDVGAYWRLLTEGRDATGEVPADRFDIDVWYDKDPAAPGKIYTRRGGFMDRVDLFDAAFFGISPLEAESMDPQQRLLLETAWQALEHGGLSADKLAGTQVGVFVGVSTNDYAELLKLRGPEAIDAYRGTGTMHSVAAGRLSYFLGLQGPTVSIDTACSSSLVAVHQACQALRADECSAALAAGVNVIIGPEMMIRLSRSSALSPDGRCKTFDASANGYGRGEGVGVVVLKRLTDAERDGDRILAVIRGSAVNQDGASGGLTVPSGPAQERLINAALHRAGLEPASVAYLESHGTGTVLGDPIEVGAAGRVFGVGRGVGRPLLLGSVKANIGHLEAAAGVAGLIKVVLSLEAGELPGQVHFAEPNPHVAWASLPVEVVRTKRAWPEGRRLAGVSSFGFSGTNAHVIVEGYGAPAAAGSALPGREAQVLALSAKSAGALEALIARYAAFVGETETLSLSDVCFTAGVGRSHFAHRAAVVAQTREALASGLAGLAAGSAGVRGERRGRARVAVLFTGQGSQWAGMAQGAYASEPVFRDVVDRCCAAADALGLHGESVRAVLLAEPGTALAGLLDDTAYTQVALYGLQCGLWSLWRSWGLEADAVLGHSVGEFAAAYAAGVLDLEDGARLVARRGALMGALPAGGSMAVVFAPPAAVSAAIARVNDEAGAGEAGAGAIGLSLAAENGTHRVVSGPSALVDALVSGFAQAGVRCQALSVSHAFHSALLEPMLDALEASASGVSHRAPSLSLVSNLTGAVFAPGTHPDAAYWRRHARAPVRYAEGVATLASLGIDVLLELGPRPVLSGLALGCWPGASSPVALSALRPGVSDGRALADAVAGLYAAGGSIDFAGYGAGRGGRRVALPSYPFERVRHWMEAPRGRGRGAVGEAGHWLLGASHGSASGEVSWTQELSASEPGWTADHVVFGAVVAPGALHACLAAAAGGIAGGSGVSVRTGQIHAPLVLGEAATELQLLLAAADGSGSRGWRVFARQGEGSEPAWRLYASGVLAAADAAVAEPRLAMSGLPLSGLPLSGLVERDVVSFYAALSGLGLAYGPSFQGVERLWGGAWVARGEIVMPDGVVDGALHPAVLDACFQVLMAALPDAAMAAGPLVPLGWDGFDVWGPAPGRVVCEARVRSSADASAFVADLVLLDGAGAVFARVQGLLLKRTTRQALLGAAAGVDELLYEVAWQEAGLPTFAAGFMASPGAVVDAVRPLIGGLAAETGFEATRQSMLETLLEQASRAHAVAALRQLGWSPRVGDAVVAASLRAALGVRAEHARLFERLLELLGDAGLLTRVGEHQAGEHQAGEQAGQWLVAAPLETGPSVDAVAAEAAAYGAEGTGGITGEIAWVLLSRCGLVLAEVLRGRVAPLGLLFPEQDIGAAELYRDAPIFRLMNALLGASVARAVADLPPGRRLRVLEVGAGTGGTTAALLPLLPRERTEYVYTDVSAGFFAAGEARFGSAYPYVQFRPLDIERDPLAQGFAAGGYDLVVASNVLHATRDVVASAAHCRSLLAPGGSLVLLEELQRRGWSDLTFGLLEGWWRFADPALRPAHALLNGATWRAALQAAGYAEAAVLSPDAGELQGVVLARAPADVAAGLWLVAGDTGPGNEQSAGQGAGEQLAAALSAQGQRVVLALPGASLERDASPEASIDRWRLRTGEASDWRALLASLPAGPGLRGPGLRGVVHLAGLDAGQAAVEAISDATCGRLSGDAASIVGGALALSQGLIGHDAVPSAGLWFVTQGAQVVAGEQAGGLAGSALWGMARTLAHEHPELRVRRVDLEAGLAPSAQLAGLVDELMAPDAEDEVARRGPARLVPRLVRAGGRSPDAQARLALPQAAGWRLAKGGERTLAGLTIEPVELAEPGPGEVLVAVEAAGLNFRDVLDALGMVPVDAGPLGGEFAGRVLAVGAGVSDVAPGERVVGLAVGCFGDRVSTKRALLAPWPAGLAPAAAAALPIVFCTAALAFERAGLRPGERVLIHAGAGGVGLAAIALAHAAGAEVFATASAGKQAYLRGLGVRHVYDSRSTAFAAAILADTDGRGVDVVLNSLTGEGFVAASLQALGAGGRFVEIGKRAIWTPEAMAAARADVAYHILAVDRLQAEEPERTGAALRAVLARVESGELAPLPYVSYPLTEARAAMRHMQQARHVGKIVLTAPPAAAVVRPGVTYLITGGLGGIGLVVADWLADRGATHLALNGRRAPEAAAEAAVAALRSRGVVVELLLADVAQPGAVERMLAELDARLPPLAGVIHSVGVLRDGALANQDWPRFADVLGPKMLGAWALHCATRDRHLDMFVLFASTAGLLGNRGQANHAAANVFLDQLARHRRAQGLPGLSIDWGAWSDIGEAAERRDALEASLQAAGIGWMTPAQGLAAFDRALSGPASQLAVFAAHWDRLSGSPSALLRTILATPTRATAAPAPLAAITQRLARAPQFQRRNELTNWLAQTIQKLLRLQQPPEPGTRFSELGMDSLMSVELRNRLNAELKLDPPMPATVLFDSPNLEALADTIEQHQGLGPSAEPEPVVAMPASPVVVDAVPHSESTLRGVAIIGMACRFPGARNLDEYWRLLADGVDAVGPIPADRRDIAPPAEPGAPPIQAGLLDGVDDFDPLHFRISPDEAPYIDPQQRLLLETTWHALEDAGLPVSELAGTKTGVFVGIGTADFAIRHAHRPDALSAYSGAGTGGFAAANRISYSFDLHGPSMAVNTACASSLTALHLAVTSLESGECDFAVVGGVNLILHPYEFISLEKANVLSPSGRCRSFSSDADGYVRGEGCGVVVLRRYADAAAEGRRVAAVVRGTAVSHVGASNGMSAPNGPAQEAVMRAAASRAGIDPGEIDYIETQGTGTNLGDAIEMGAIRRVMAQERDPAHPLRVGAVKPNIGNLEEASGMAGLIKTVLSMRHGVIPGMLHFRELNRNIVLGSSQIRIVTEKEAWRRGPSNKRRAAVSGFGYGGVNAHAFLEEPVETLESKMPEERWPLLLTVRSRTDASLASMAARYADALAGAAAHDIDRFCVAANTGRSEFGQRLAIVADDRETLVKRLRDAAGGTLARAPKGRRRVAFLFAGQEPPAGLKLTDLYRDEPAFSETVDRCVASLELAERRVLLACFTAGAVPAVDARHSVPLLYMLQSALVALWESWGVRPDIVLGHEAGVLAAAACAGSIQLEHGMTLAVEHGRLAAAMPSVMANHTMQDEALPDPAFRAYAATLPHGPATRPLLTTGGIDLKAGQSMEWQGYRSTGDVADAFRRLERAGANVLLEIGPGRSFDADRLDSRDDAAWVASFDPGQPTGRAALAEAVGSLYVAGCSVDFAAWHHSTGTPQVDIPLYEFERQPYRLEDALSKAPTDQRLT